MPRKRIVIRSQSKATTRVVQTQNDTAFCVCPDPTHTLPVMEEDQKKEFKSLLKNL